MEPAFLAWGGGTDVGASPLPTPPLMNVRTGPEIRWLLVRPPTRPPLQHKFRSPPPLTSRTLSPHPHQLEKPYPTPQLAPHPVCACTAPCWTCHPTCLQFLNFPTTLGTQSLARPQIPRLSPSIPLILVQMSPSSSCILEPASTASHPFLTSRTAVSLLLHVAPVLPSSLETPPLPQLPPADPVSAPAILAG